MKTLIFALSLLTLSSSFAIDLTYNTDDVADVLEMSEFPVDGIMEADASQVKKMESTGCEENTVASRSLRAFLVDSEGELFLFATPSGLNKIKMCKPITRAEFIQLLRI
ncbi:MAG: hypothetical protein NXH75_02205 [Halobacteriovoraceae bacterium]|nr:hypothetical protein [Halobacteriovoraceae bacterium]